jgi:hypothetical protein
MWFLLETGSSSVPRGTLEHNSTRAVPTLGLVAQPSGLLICQSLVTA